LDCSQTIRISDREYLQRFNEKVSRQRIPLSGSLDLTWQCNLNCIHCYLGKKSDRIDHIFREASTEKWIRIIDEITAAGCLHLLITGGEPLLRKDFLKIYQYAIQKGLLVTVFSNGTCVTKDIIDIFKDLPPQAVEISLYGATSDTFERITRVKDSYKLCMEGINLLLDHGIRVALKTILMSVNFHEFSAIESIARDLGVKFRLDAALFPCLNGDQSPLDFRVRAEDAVALEMSNVERYRKWGEYYLKTQNLQHPISLYKCGAGVASFYIDPSLKLHPCLITSKPEFDLLIGSFQEGWKTVIPEIHDKNYSIDTCSSCEKIALCGYCPAFFQLEKGNEEICSEYLCEIGKHRLEAVCKYQTEEPISKRFKSVTPAKADVQKRTENSR
jgi:radical SAM protein with 4Fe4S-binding SPASM domain